ncbi:MAG: hypothetical protein HQ575_00475 [Candidatus Omnitrophica bacterium]|nr:hypothetical protein [Candidatus Omnitrophota bacterium]
MKQKIFLTLIILLLFSYPAFSQQKHTLDLDKVTIPKELGTIKEFYQSPAISKRDMRIIFHIQDVHANYEAQKNLADILEYLIATYGLNIILVEGGITDKDFSYIREWAPLDERKTKAEELLKEGVISGETYVDIATDFPLKFQGIEDKELYEKNMEVYLKVDSFRSGDLDVIKKLVVASDRLKKFIYTKRLKEFDKNKSDYRAERMELIEYLKYLDKITSREKIGLEGYENYQIILKTARFEDILDFKNIENERDSLIKRLSELLVKDRLDDLLLKSLEFKEEKISAGEFYSYLSELSRSVNMDRSRCEDLDKYVDYLETYEMLDSKGLFREIAEIEYAISGALCKNEAQKKLFAISNDLVVLESFLKLKFAPEDLDYYRNNKEGFNIDAWKAFLADESKRFRIDCDMPEDTALLMNNLATLENFYNVAFERDEAFLRNSLEKMNKERARFAVLITGGFHTKNLTRLFKENAISYLVLTPNLTQATDEELYDRVLKESYKTRTWSDE